MLLDEDPPLDDLPLSFPELERFTAPLEYWKVVQPTATLRYAFVYRDYSRHWPGLDNNFDPIGLILPLKAFTELDQHNAVSYSMGYTRKSVDIHETFTANSRFARP